MKVDNSEKYVLDYVDRTGELADVEEVCNKMYTLEKYLADGGKLDILDKIYMRQAIRELRQWLQSIQRS